MADFAAHENQAKHNSHLLEYLRGEGKNKQFSDWYLTIAFYSAVHLVEAAIFANDQEISWTLQNNSKTRTFFKCSHSEEGKGKANCASEHEFRLKMLKENRRIFGNLYPAFANLYERSRMARYQCYIEKENDFDLADSWLNVVRREYTEFIRKQSAPPDPLAGLNRKI